MKYTRIYADAAGESHFEDVEVDYANQLRPDIAASATIAFAAGYFRHSLDSYYSDWHAASRSQFIFTVVGEIEIEVSDGEVRRFGPGSVLLADDLTGKGHITRYAEGAAHDHEAVFVPLAN